ncbi:MAG TPA: transglutaminase-like domain-containing protein [Candidatus Solibacter sp.]|jgi:hypothetical protein
MAGTDPYCAFDESWEPAGEKHQRRSFRSWTDVSKWLNELLDPRVVPTEPLAAKARDLVSNSRKEFDRIEAIGRYVQGLSYLGTGGAHRPHRASQVFADGYGDCKDKANLLRTMLRSVGVEAWLAAINTGELGYVIADRPSLRWFNHVIVAIRVSDKVRSEAVAKYRTFGRLLFFDPTDQHIPFGRLRDCEFGIQALIVADENGRLVRMPSPRVAHSTDRRRHPTPAADSDTTAHVGERNVESTVAANRNFRSTGSPPKSVPNLPKKKPLLARKIPRR